jgi:hypothetical protein
MVLFAFGPQPGPRKSLEERGNGGRSRRTRRDRWAPPVARRSGPDALACSTSDLPSTSRGACERNSPERASSAWPCLAPTCEWGRPRARWRPPARMAVRRRSRSVTCSTGVRVNHDPIRPGGKAADVRDDGEAAVVRPKRHEPHARPRRRSAPAARRCWASVSSLNRPTHTPRARARSRRPVRDA